MTIVKSSKLSASLEDYLEAIFNLAGQNNITRKYGALQSGLGEEKINCIEGYIQKLSQLKCSDRLLDI